MATHHPAPDPTTKKPNTKILGCGDDDNDDVLLVVPDIVILLIGDKHVDSVGKSHVVSGGYDNTIETENRTICSCTGAADLLKADADVTCKIGAFGAKATDKKNA